MKNSTIKTVKSLGLTLALFVGMAISGSMAQAADLNPANWDDVLKQAKGQTVYFHAWGGSPRINDYIGWAGKELQSLTKRAKN